MNGKDLYIRSSSAEFLIFEQPKKEKGIEVLNHIIDDFLK